MDYLTLKKNNKNKKNNKSFFNTCFNIFKKNANLMNKKFKKSQNKTINTIEDKKSSILNTPGKSIVFYKTSKIIKNNNKNIKNFKIKTKKKYFLNKSYEHKIQNINYNKILKINKNDFINFKNEYILFKNDSKKILKKKEETNRIKLVKFDYFKHIKNIIIKFEIILNKIYINNKKRNSLHFIILLNIVNIEKPFQRNRLLSCKKKHNKFIFGPKRVNSILKMINSTRIIQKIENKEEKIKKPIRKKKKKSKYIKSFVDADFKNKIRIKKTINISKKKENLWIDKIDNLLKKKDLFLEIDNYSIGYYDTKEFYLNRNINYELINYSNLIRNL